jgi:hypothetical protein
MGLLAFVIAFLSTFLMAMGEEGPGRVTTPDDYTSWDRLLAERFRARFAVGVVLALLSLLPSCSRKEAGAVLFLAGICFGLSASAFRGLTRLEGRRHVVSAPPLPNHQAESSNAGNAVGAPRDRRHLLPDQEVDPWTVVCPACLFHKPACVCASADATSIASKVDAMTDESVCSCGHRRRSHFKTGDCFVRGCSCRTFCPKRGSSGPLNGK